jgi:putative membrane protein
MNGARANNSRINKRAAAVPGPQRYVELVFATVRRWFDPHEVREVGSTPDYRFSLANERTFLAWIRTGLALLGGGLAIAGFLPPLHVPYLREGLALALIALGGLIALRAVDHWSRCERAMRLGQPLPASRFPAVLALAVGLGAVALLVAIIVPGPMR